MNMRSLCDSFDLESYVADKGGEEIQTGEWLLICPLCGKRKLAVNLEKRVWHCWIDEEYGPPNAQGKRSILKGAGGVLQLVMLLESVDYSQAIHFLNTHSLFHPTDLGRIEFNIVSDVPIPPRPIPYPDYWHDVDGTLPYMLKRGITVEDARAFRLGWCSAGRYRNRLMFPVYENNRLMYYQGRAMWDPSPGETYIKTLNPPKAEGQVVSSDVLMNLDQACAYPSVAITEGPIDAVHVGPDAVCSFGKKLSMQQTQKLLEYGVKSLELIWDGPSQSEPHGAWPEMFEAAKRLEAWFRVKLVFLPQGDPGDYTRDQLREYRTHAKPLSAFGVLL